MSKTVFHQPPHSLFTQQVEIVHHFRLFLDSLVQEGADLHDILNNLHMASELDTLEIRINSCGGFVKYGQQFINVIQDKFSERCVTVLDAEASSMAALLFMVGSQRIIYPHSILMVHDLSMYLGGKASESVRHMEVYLPVFTKYFENIIGECMTPDEIQEMFNGKDYWFDSIAMCKRGIAHSVIVNGDVISAEKYLELAEKDTVVPKKLKKKKGKKRGS